MKFTLPKGMLLGAASAAAQVEGGDVNSNWNDWYRKGRIKDGSDPAASDHWLRIGEDTELMASLGVQIYRFGLEWARIVPSPGVVDEAAVSGYRDELSAMIKKGIKPLVTIHHFANPMWFEDKGAFTKKENLEDFLWFVKLVAERFGDLASEYITINEPNVYATNGYAFGEWPPGEKSMLRALGVMSNMACCHIKAYGIIHETRRAMGYTDTMVGFANHLRVFDPKNPKNLWHRMCAKLTEWLFQGAVTKAMSVGKFSFPLKNIGRLPAGEYADFHGINYYTRSTVSGISDGVKDNTPRNDLDWEIYPEGIVRTTEKVLRVLKRPVWVTENGTCDNDDRFRARYICEHFKAMADSALPFERYYHWCLCDNFEWIEGNTSRFGLIHIDFDEDRKRTVKQSGRFFSEVIKAGAITDEIYNKYVRDEVYDIR